MKSINEHTRIEQLIELYLSEKIDEDSFKELEQWTSQSEAHRLYVRERLIWFSLGISETPNNAEFNISNKYKQLEHRIKMDGKMEQTIKVRAMWTYIKWVAAVVILILLPLGGFWLNGALHTSHMADIKLETEKGSRMKLSLPDGTVVWLNADSKLTYSQNFGIDNRHVSLEGEAYFDVRHNEKLPFTVHTKDIDLKVLGTQFTFSNYPEDNIAKVDLLKGKVFLSDNTSRQEMYLSPNEQMLLDKHTNKMERRTIDAALSTSWTQGRLFFDNQSLAQLAKILERHYDKKIKVAQSVQSLSFSGNFDTKQNTLEDILRAISSTQQMKYRYKNGEYILY